MQRVACQLFPYKMRVSIIPPWLSNRQCILLFAFDAREQFGVLMLNYAATGYRRLGSGHIGYFDCLGPERRLQPASQLPVNASELRLEPIQSTFRQATSTGFFENLQ